MFQGRCSIYNESFVVGFLHVAVAVAKGEVVWQACHMPRQPMSQQEMHAVSTQINTSSLMMAGCFSSPTYAIGYSLQLKSGASLLANQDGVNHFRAHRLAQCAAIIVWRDVTI